MIKWTLETRRIDSLIEYEKNARYIKKDDLKQLQTSINKFGLIDKPIINRDNTIVGGHQRINALRLSNIQDVECWIPHRQLSDKEVEECNIRLNKNTGNWNYEILANEWDVLDLLSWGFTSTELEYEEVKEVVAKEEDEEEQDKTISCPKCKHRFLK